MPESIISHSSPEIGEDEIDALIACVRSLQIKGGNRLKELESCISNDLSYAGAVGTTTGGHAIHLALRALFSGKSKRVGVPSYICRSVYDAVILADCQPQLLDIDLTNFSVSSDAAVNANLDAIIVPHMFGIQAPIEEFLSTGIVVIEDCAQRINVGERANLEPKGTVRILSFESTKVITCGEGGMLLSDDPTVLARAYQLRDGQYDSLEPAAWLPLADIQASIAHVQWKRLPDFIARRKEIAAFYYERIGEKFTENLIPSMNLADTIPFRFLLWVDNPIRCIRKAESLNVIFRRPIAPFPLHHLIKSDESFPCSENAFNHLVSIPIYPRLTQPDVERVAQAAVESLSTHD